MKNIVMKNIGGFMADTQRPVESGIGAKVINGLWVVTVLVWPLLKWVLSMDCLYQLGRMLYYWDTPWVHGGWTFLFHFTFFTVLTYFVSIYKPKGI